MNMIKQIIITIGFIFFGGIGCANCSGDLPPNIRTVPGIENCDAAFKNLSDKHCDKYLEPVAMPLEDGGTETLDWAGFCKYEMSNSIPINTSCLMTVKTCEEIQTVCNE